MNIKQTLNTLVAILCLFSCANISFAQNLQLDFSGQDPTCAGFTTGIITAIPSGGQQPYTFAWSTGATSLQLAGINAGVYSLTLTDANGMTVSGSYTLNEPPPLQASITNSNGNCSAIGQLITNISGGVGGYTYLWSTGETTPTITTTVSDLYCVTITDQNSCGIVECFTVNQSFNVEVRVVDSPCFMLCDGSATAVVNGGTAPFTYAWNTGSSDPAIFPLPAGTYTVTVTDQNGCTSVSSGVVNEPGEIMPIVTVNSPACGAANGSATVSATGGVPPYNYTWSTGAVGSSINNLAPGTYRVVVVDANNCPKEEIFTINSQTGLSVGLTPTNPSCLAPNGGTITSTVTGGTAPFNYTWSNGSTSTNLTNLSGGAYSVTVTDATGCQGVASTSLTSASTITLTVNGTNPTGCNNGNGSVTTSISGNTGAVTYAWSNGATTSSINNLNGGSYSVTVTETASGCSATGTANLTEATGFTIMLPTVGVSCNGDNDGSANVLVTGGTAPFNFAWSNGITTSLLDNVTAGNYSVTVTDANNCQQIGSTTVTEPATLSCTISGTDPTAAGNDGSASINVTGGSQPFTYAWSNNATAPNINGLAAGTYSVTVTDLQDCTTTCSVTLTGTTPPPTPSAKLGNLVWEDDNEDGIFNNGEIGVANVRAVLTGTTAAGIAVTSTTTTDNTGMYMFGGLEAGDYKVTFTLPTAYRYTLQNAGNDDALDSDVDPVMSMTPVVTLADHEVNLTLDAGIICDNVRNPGTISADQTLCGPGNTPAPLVEVTPASGTTGQLEYIWMRSNNNGAFTNGTWSIIPGSTGRNYSPGPIYQTTYFARCVRRVGCNDFLETNVITITIGNDATAAFTGPNWICSGDDATFEADDAGPGATYTWNLGLGATPQTATGRTVTARYASFGFFEVTLTVNVNGCTASTIRDLTVGCTNPLMLKGEMLNPQSVLLTIEGIANLQEGRILVERSADNRTFAQFDELQAEYVNSDKYELIDYNPHAGITYYRAFLEAPRFNNYSEVIEVAVYQSKFDVSIFPNPATDFLQFEVPETAKKPTRLGIYDTEGKMLYDLNIAEVAGTQQVDISDLPQGIYIAKFLFEGQTARSFKFMKKTAE